MSTSRSAPLRFHECHSRPSRGKTVNHDRGGATGGGGIASKEDRAKLRHHHRSRLRSAAYLQFAPPWKSDGAHVYQGRRRDAINIPSSSTSSRFGGGKLPSFGASHVCRVRPRMHGWDGRAEGTLEVICSALGALLTTIAFRPSPSFYSHIQFHLTYALPTPVPI